MVTSSFRRCAIVALLALGALARPAHAEPVAADSLRIPPPAIRRWQVGLLRPDRIQHASLSLTLGLAAGLLTRRPGIAVATGLGLGLAKEVYDLHGTGFDPVDLLADGLGTGTAALATSAVVH